MIITMHLFFDQLKHHISLLGLTNLKVRFVPSAKNERQIVDKCEKLSATDQISRARIVISYQL
jgi:hypothetical protein